MSTDERESRETAKAAKPSAADALRALADASEEAERIRQLLNDALESMSEGLVLFDSDDRIVVCNSKYRNYFGDVVGIDVGEMVQPGAQLWDIMRAAHAKGMFPNIPKDGLEAHIERRRVSRRKGGGTIEQLMKDGRWLQINEHRTAGGGVASVYTDVTEIKRREAELAAQTAKLESLSSQLAKYLPPQVYKSIFAGEQSVDVAPKRKKLTIFFSDIAGFTDTVEAMESEDLTNLLNQYLTEMSRIAQAHGATVGKYIGDAILAFFGDPVSRGLQEDATACVRMAIAMQQRMRELRGIWQDRALEKPFELRVGITTGYCTVGNFGSEDRLDYTVIGNAVNLAARLQTAAERGAILLDSETHSLIKDTIKTSERGAINVKGLSRPVHVHAVEGIYDDEDASGRVISLQRDGLRLLIECDKLSAGAKAEAIDALTAALKRLQE